MIYFIQDQTTLLIKIGYAKDPWERARVLQVGCPGRLVVVEAHPGDLLMETYLHSRLASERVRGEWYRPSALVLIFMVGGAVIKTVDEMAEKYGSQGVQCF